MIYAFSGDDSLKIREELLIIKQKYPHHSFHDIVSLSKNKDKLIDLSSSISMFGGGVIVFVELGSADTEFILSKEFSAIVDQFAKKEDILVLNLSDNFNKNTKPYKLISGKCVIRDFADKPSFWNFNFCDEFFIKRNKKNALDMLTKISDKEVNEGFYQLISLLQTYARMVISMKYNNEFWKSQKPFFKSKFNDGCNIKDAIAMYDNLLRLDLSSKSSSKDLRSLLMDFIIYTEYH